MTTQNFRVYAYLRASTKEQDASRSQEELKKFAEEKGLTIKDYYFENESGTILERPELFKIINRACPEDVNIILIEDVDRLTRLDDENWVKLKAILDSKKINIVALELPTSHAILSYKENIDEFLRAMLRSVNNLILDFAAIFARKVYDIRKKRCDQGRENAKKRGVVFGRKRGELGKRMQEAEPKILSILTKHPKLSAGLVGKMEKANRDTVRKIAKKNGFEYYGKELGWLQKTEIQTKTKINN